MAQPQPDDPRPAAERKPLHEALYRISSQVSRTRDPHAALQAILAELLAYFRASSGSIALINPDSNRLEIETFHGLPPYSKEVQLRLGQGVTGWVAMHGEPLLIPDVAADVRYFPVLESIACEMAVPMLHGNLSIGVINLDSETAHAWDDADLHALITLTKAATEVVHTLWEIRQLQQKGEHLESIISMGQRLVAKLEVGDLLAAAAEEARTLMDCRLAAVFLLSSDQQMLSLQSLSGSEAHRDYTEHLKLEESAVGTAIHRRKQVEVLDICRTEEHHFIPIVREENLVSMLSTPIAYEDEVIGVLNVYTDFFHRFNNDEKRILRTLASLSAVAVQNARLYGRTLESEESLRKNERLTMLGLLAAEIAHEIRNPLMVIKLLFSSMGLDFAESDPRKRDVEVIGEKLQQMEDTVSRVLSAGKSREGLHARWQIRALLGDTLHLVRLKLRQSLIEVRYEAKNEPLVVEASKGQLQQVFLNVLMNAIQAMPHGGEILIESRREEGAHESLAVVEFTDTGPGIPSEIRDRVFDGFLTGREEGVGLGLSIVKRILKSHRGDIEVAATSEKGTRLRLWLPCL